MKRSLVFVLLLFIGFGLLLMSVFSRKMITAVGEWGGGPYADIAVMGPQAYCVRSDAGFDIVDISNPSRPVKSGSYVPSQESPAFKAAARGGLVYIADEKNGLQIIDASVPAAPVLKSTWKPRKGKLAYILAVEGGYAYAAGYNGGEAGKASDYFFQVLDVSNPASPRPEALCSTPFIPSAVCFNGSFLYVGMYMSSPGSNAPAGGFLIFGGSSRGAPKQLGRIAVPASGIFSAGNLVYLGRPGHGLEVVDVSNPARPVRLEGDEQLPDSGNIFVDGGTLYHTTDRGLDTYLLDGTGILRKQASLPCDGGYGALFVQRNKVYACRGGLHIIDVSVPGEPKAQGTFTSVEQLENFFVHGHYAYLADRDHRLKILKLTNPSGPELASLYAFAQHPEDIYVSGRYAYVLTAAGLTILDISNPSLPVREGGCDIYCGESLYVNGDYAYITDPYGLLLVDVSRASSPSPVGRVKGVTPVQVRARGQYVYCAGTEGVTIIDAGTAEQPAILGHFRLTGKGVLGMAIRDHHAYLAADDGLHIVDISRPAAPARVGFFAAPGRAGSVDVADGFAYVLSPDRGILDVLDVSEPESPRRAVSYDTGGWAIGAYARPPYVYIANSSGMMVLNFNPSGAPPILRLNHDRLNLAAEQYGVSSSPQALRIENIGGGELNWTVSTDKKWLRCSQSVGTQDTNIAVSADMDGLEQGTYTGTVTVTASHSANPPQQVRVSLKVYPRGRTGKPFGAFTSPENQTVVSGCLPLAGWALDDIGIQSVQLFREDKTSKVYLGDAVFLPGARADIEKEKSGYPDHYRSGWGYLLHTDWLPNGGRGNFRLHAVATDAEGNRVTLGTRDFRCKNDGEKRIFGTMITPGQGGIARGSAFANRGWLMESSRDSVPGNEPVLSVWVDGVRVEDAEFRRVREETLPVFADLPSASARPVLAASPGHAYGGAQAVPAVSVGESSETEFYLHGKEGRVTLDTTGYQNGLHAIAWTLCDGRGGERVLDHRIFEVNNRVSPPANTPTFRYPRSIFQVDPSDVPLDYINPVGIQVGYRKDGMFRTAAPGDSGRIVINLSELERLEIRLKLPRKELKKQKTFYEGYQLIGGELRKLPVGSTLDMVKGVFSWQPGPGFVGEYQLVFIENRVKGEAKKKHVTINIGI